jgi:hypothetical protein
LEKSLIIKENNYYTIIDDSLRNIYRNYGETYIRVTKAIWLKLESGDKWSTIWDKPKLKELEEYFLENSAPLREQLKLF